MMKAGEELTGPAATGRAGDVVLENDEVVLVIANGNLVDAADAHARVDELGGLEVYTGTPGGGASYTSRTTGALADGTAFVEARGYLRDDTSVVVHTRYTLHKNDRAALLETTIENATTHSLTLAALGDAVTWGAKRTLATSAFAGAVGDKTSYALTSTDGTIAWDAGHAIVRLHVEVAPGKSVSFARVFVIGPRADSAGLVAELTKMSGGEVGTLAVQVTADGKNTSVPDAVIEIDDESGHPVMDLRGDASGAIGGELPLGTYQLRFLRGGGRVAHGSPATVSIASGREATATVEVEP